MVQSLNKKIHNPFDLKKKEFINNKLKDKPIVLVGMMGTGKTAIGKLIAKKLKRNFYDLDHIIEAKYQTSISKIFQKLGEREFREIEYTELTRINDSNSIIATGGGTYINSKSHQYINKIGFIIWIKATSNIIYNRTKNNNNRPLLKGSDIIKKIKNLLKEREPIYSKAMLSVEAKKKNKLEMTKNIINSLEKYLIENSND